MNAKKGFGLALVVVVSAWGGRSLWRRIFPTAESYASEIELDPPFVDAAPAARSAVEVEYSQGVRNTGLHDVADVRVAVECTVNGVARTATFRAGAIPAGRAARAEGRVGPYAAALLVMPTCKYRVESIDLAN